MSSPHPRCSCDDSRNAPDPAPPAPRPEEPAQAKRWRILLVDDEKLILASLRRLLRSEPYEILTAGSGEEALSLLEEKPVHLIVSDQLMPGMTGLELLREVRRRWPERIGVILSGYTEVNTIIAAINEGEIYKFLTKPWNDEELKLNLRRAVEQYELEAENRRMSGEILEQNRKLRALNELLDRRAADAALGLNFAQEMLESLGVGVIGVDDTGMVVWANAQARTLIRVGVGDAVGGRRAGPLPEALSKALGKETSEARVRGACTAEGRSLAFCVTSFGAGEEFRGRVAAVWES